MGDVECWLPEKEVFYGDYLTEFRSYIARLHQAFIDDFLKNKPFFRKMPVNIRKHPQVDGQIEAFRHITGKREDHLEGGRALDPERLERVRWARAFIDNYLKCQSCKFEACQGVKVWKEPYKNTFRVHLLLKEERYVVILEERTGYYLLITAFYLNYAHELEKQLRNYERYRRNGQRV